MTLRKADEPSEHRKFSEARFSALLLGQVALFVLGFSKLFPDVFTRQIIAGPLAIMRAFVVAVFINCFVEWFFHRYFLHWAPVPMLKNLATQHRKHHKLTIIKLESGPQGTYILNRYPITEKDQYESSAFPWWSLVAFWAIFTPFLMALQFALPDQPVLLPGYLSVAWSMGTYELIHAVEHRPFEWWKQATDHPKFGTFWKRVYGFHEMHHFRVQYNESISGFFGLPIADWVFRTYYQPRELLLTGRLATAKDFDPPKPRWFIAKLDRLAKRLEVGLAHAA